MPRSSMTLGYREDRVGKQLKQDDEPKNLK